MPTANSKKTSKKWKSHKIPMSLFQRRSDELAGAFEKNFADRVIKLFATERNVNLISLKNDVETFLASLRTEFIWGNGTTQYVTVTRLTKILKTSPQTIRELLPHSTVFLLVKMTNFNLAIAMTLIEELMKLFLHAEETYIKLLPYCDNSREITSGGLQDFIVEIYIPEMVEEPERADYYAAYAAEIIFFLLEARRRESIYVKDLIASTLLFQLEACIHAENNCTEIPPNDIFTVASFRSALHEFRSLDVDRNGVLSEAELLEFKNSYFNPIFIKRVFEISMTYEKGCLDFKGFVDLLCAVKFRHTKASAKFHFEALDLKEDGVLDYDEIRTATKWMDKYAPDEPEMNTDILSAELQDMLSVQKIITLDDFVTNLMGPVFTGFVSNYIDYMKYERREQ